MHRSSLILDSMRSADLTNAPRAVASAPIHHVRAVLQDCLARLDALDAPVAAAHLSACLDVLRQDVNPD